MDSSLATSNRCDGSHGLRDKESMVDPFLVEALQNPRHRLTVLRMELDIQRFLQNPEQQHFEFQHFPTSYLRLAAHRVAQHYGLPTMVQDSGLDGNKIVVRKLVDAKYPLVLLSEIPAKQLENDKPEQIKISIRRRPDRSSMNEADEAGRRQNPVRSMEERKEEYDRARARIFSSSSSSADETSLQGPLVGKSYFMGADENGCGRNSMIDSEKIINVRDNGRVAIFRDREKDRSDPDYDRSYGRYARNLPSAQSINFSVQNFQTPFAQYDIGFPQLGQMPQTQTSASYRPASAAVMNPFCALGMSQTSRDAAYQQWPSTAIMYAHPYDQFRHAVVQLVENQTRWRKLPYFNSSYSTPPIAPFGQQPLSFDHLQNY